MNGFSNSSMKMYDPVNTIAWKPKLYTSYRQTDREGEEKKERKNKQTWMCHLWHFAIIICNEQNYDGRVVVIYFFFFAYVPVTRSPNVAVLHMTLQRT